MLLFPSLVTKFAEEKSGILKRHQVVHQTSSAASHVDKPSQINNVLFADGWRQPAVLLSALCISTVFNFSKCLQSVSLPHVSSGLDLGSSICWQRGFLCGGWELRRGSQRRAVSLGCATQVSALRRDSIGAFPSADKKAGGFSQAEGRCFGFSPDCLLRGHYSGTTNQVLTVSSLAEGSSQWRNGSRKPRPSPSTPHQRTLRCSPLAGVKSLQLLLGSALLRPFKQIKKEKSLSSAPFPRAESLSCRQFVPLRPSESGVGAGAARCS